MAEPFDAREYAAYLRRRWRFFAIACGSAAACALVASLVLPNEYTATVRIVIEPAGAQAAAPVTPEYLESLRMYETFAASDAIFARAASRFHLRETNPGASLSSLKKKVLDVTKLRDTRILEIRATIEDAQQALELARYIAEQAVALNQSVNGALQQEAIESAQRDVESARAARDRAEAEWTAAAQHGNTDTLQDEVYSLVDLRSRVRREWIAANAGGERAKAASLEKQYEAIDQEYRRKSGQLSRIASQREVLEARASAARKLFDGAQTRLLEVQAAAGNRGDRLEIADNGTTPWSPSSPKTMRNIGAAVLIALVVSLLYLSAAYTSSRRTGELIAQNRARF